MRQERPRARDGVSLEAAMIARRYYLDNKQKNEIADELGISRFKVARLLDEARDSGIVHIHIDVPTEVDLDLGDRVAKRFGVPRVIAARALDEDDASLWPVIGAAAANLLASVIGSQDVLGISWGRALSSTVEAFSARTMTDVVQPVGGVELVRRMAEATGGHAYPLNAPLILGSAAIASALRTDPSLADSMDRFTALTVAAVGVGSWNPPHSAVATELNDSERDTVASLGVAADVCGILFDANGAEVASPLRDRTVGIDLEGLRRIPEVVAVAGGRDKVSAIASVLRSGVVSTLVTDTRTAQRLLAV